jgi:hypothetical protein
MTVIARPRCTFPPAAATRAPASCSAAAPRLRSMSLVSTGSLRGFAPASGHTAASRLLRRCGCGTGSGCSARSGSGSGGSVSRRPNLSVGDSQVPHVELFIRRNIHQREAPIPFVDSRVSRIQPRQTASREAGYLLVEHIRLGVLRCSVKMSDENRVRGSQVRPARGVHG